MGRRTHACSIILCLVVGIVIAVVVSDSVAALSGGEVCRTHRSPRNTRNDQTWCRSKSWCGVGQSAGCKGSSSTKLFSFTNPDRRVLKYDDGTPGFLQYDDRCCQGYKQGWKPKGKINLLKSVDFNVPAPYRKAAISHFTADDAVSAWVNGIEVFRAGRFKVKRASDGKIVGKKYLGTEDPPFEEAVGCGNLDPPKGGQINKEITQLNAVREGANTLEVYGCYGGDTSYPDAWVRLCYEYGSGTPSGSGCVAPVACTPRTESELCADNGFTCGTHDVINNCDQSQTITCGAPCTPSCTPDPPSECVGKCDMITDSCGNPLDCGTCGTGTCGLYSANECGCQVAGSCNGDTYEQTNSDCSVYTEYCDPSIQQCTPSGCVCTVTDAQACQGPPKRCGVVPQITDACGNERYDVFCGNTCSLNEECVNNVCQVCDVPDQATACGTQKCGSVTVIDSCNRAVSISCGECAGGEFCGTNQTTGEIECQLIPDDPHLKCDIRNKGDPQPSGAVCLMETTGTNNAHANQCSGTSYSYVNECRTPLVDCSLNCAQRDGGCLADEFEIVKMSSNTNAHGEAVEVDPDGYTRSVCCKVVRDSDLSQQCAVLDCETEDVPGQLCSAGKTQAVRLSSLTNAHFGEDGNYRYASCCDIVTPCEDGLDNDGDGFIDYNGGIDAQGFPVQRDPGCTSQDDTTETDANIECDDGVDNADPEDTIADYRVVGGDPGCESPLDMDETDPDVVAPVCEADCTYEADNVCHFACNGVNGCPAAGVADICDEITIGSSVPLGDGSFAVCCAADESFPQINGSGLSYDSQRDRIRSTRIRRTTSGFTRRIIVDSFK